MTTTSNFLPLAKARAFSQGSLLWPREPFNFKSPNGRAVNAFPSQSFWVCNSSLNQASTQTVQIARSGKNAGTAWSFTLEDAHRLFQNVTTMPGQPGQNQLAAMRGQTRE